MRLRAPRAANPTGMRIGITGSSGFIGSQLALLAGERGHQAVAFSRHPRTVVRFRRGTEIFDRQRFRIFPVSMRSSILREKRSWACGTLEKTAHSSPAGWKAPRRIVEALNGTPEAPPIFICGSAIGYYGDTGEREVNESSPAGEGFLAGVSEAWEWEASPRRSRSHGSHSHRLRARTSGRCDEIDLSGLSRRPRGTIGQRAAVDVVHPCRGRRRSHPACH